jgi:hypothetical protein
LPAATNAACHSAAAARSIVAMSIFFILSIASIARFAASRLGALTSSSSRELSPCLYACRAPDG